MPVIMEHGWDGRSAASILRSRGWHCHGNFWTPKKTLPLLGRFWGVQIRKAEHCDAEELYIVRVLVIPHTMSTCVTEIEAVIPTTASHTFESQLHEAEGTIGRPNFLRVLLAGIDSLYA